MARLHRTHGFTLIELMVVVAILGVLGTLAVNVYQRYIKKSKTMEALTLLAHIRARQEAYQAEHYRYAHIPAFFPTAIQRNAKVPFTPMPAEWLQLGMQTTAKNVYFQYNTTSDQGDVTANAPPGGAATYGLVAGESWYIATAQGQFDGTIPDTTYEVVSGRDVVWKVDVFGNRGH